MPKSGRTRVITRASSGFADKMNAFAQPRRDALLNAVRRDSVLGGADAS